MPVNHVRVPYLAVHPRCQYPSSTEAAPKQYQDEIYLSTISPKDKPWNVHRANSDRVKSLYESTDLERLGNRIRDCAQILQFAAVEGEEGSLGLKLRIAHFCRVRTCPVCQWRRSMKWKARFITAIPKIIETYPTAEYVLLTLTQRNCELTELKATVQNMNKAWERLSQRKQFPAIGWVKSVEVTAVWDCYDGSRFVGRHGSTWVDKWQADRRRKLRLELTTESHPHFHVVLMVKPSYFKKGYLSQATWTELWMKSLRIDYTPIVNVKKVKPRPGHEGELGAGLAAAILETLKYGVKEDDLIADRDWLVELTKQLHKTRAVAIGGVLRDLIREDDPDDLIHDEDNPDPGQVEEGDKFHFGWRERLEEYVYQERC